MLMQRLDNTHSHFIRCIKPNSQRLPGIYNYDLVLQQLRCCGLLEVVKISRSGYPTRITHQEFAERYGFCLLENVVAQDSLGVSVIILQKLNVLPDMYQVGYSKIFFCAGQIAALEEVISRTLRGILCLQKHFRGLKARHAFLELSNGVIPLQSSIHGWKARKNFNNNVKANVEPSDKCHGMETGPLAAYNKLPLNRVVVVYDDMDLPCGVLLVQPRGGHGHHKGLKSVIYHFRGNREFGRFRIGIGRPPGQMDPKAFLLQRFNKTARERIDSALQEGVDILRTLVTKELTECSRSANPDQNYKHLRLQSIPCEEF